MGFCRLVTIAITIGIVIQIAGAVGHAALPFEEIMAYLRSLAREGRMSEKVVSSFLTPVLVQAPEWVFLGITTFTIGVFSGGSGKKLSILLSTTFPLIHGLSTILFGWWYGFPMHLGMHLFIHSFLIPTLTIPFGILSWKLGCIIATKTSPGVHCKRDVGSTGG